jgi:hypothetical protein
MAGFIRGLRELPTWVKCLALWGCVALPVFLVRDLLPRDISWTIILGVTAFMMTLYGVHRAIGLMDKSRGARLDSEIKDQTTGPSRLEFAEKEKEYKKKWVEGIQKLEKSKISLYQLPWYILLGEPGGGKTMTLLNSGMDFPLGKDELPGFGGTRNYNWWFTNHAVVLDTAGRLVFEQEGTTDRHEWESFLKLLKKRRQCPLNGVVVALPADKLLSDTTEERLQSAAVLRDRLRQIQTVLDIRFPVFLLITKCDLVAGFTEFYNELDSLQRNQLFGWSRPGAFDTPFEPAELQGGFEELYSKLHELRLRFLARQATDTEAGWIYTFPEAFRGLENRLRECLDVLFAKNIFAEPLFFRGFYFTSSLQEGKPILDVLGANLSEEKLEDLQGLFPQSRAFFIHDFYTQKVAKEQGMVFRSQKHIKRMRLLRNSTVFVGAPLAIALAVFTFFGFRAYSATVHGPREVVAAAAGLVDKYSEKQQAGEAWAVDAGETDDQKEALRLSKMLDEAIEQVQNPRGLAGLMFSSVGPQAETRIRAIQRELIGYCILRPEVAAVESALAGPNSVISPEQIDDFGTSLAAYIRWHWGAEEDGLAELAELRSVLPTPAQNYEERQAQLRQFAGATAVRAGSDTQLAAGKFVSGLTGNKEHRRRVILAALDKAQQYWLASISADGQGSSAWWALLVQHSKEVQASYTKLCSLRRDFEDARRPESFDAVKSEWLSAFPDPQRPLLLERVRQHLSANPPRENGQIMLPERLAQKARQANAEFWQVCLVASQQGQSGEDEEFATAIIKRVDTFKEEFKSASEGSAATGAHQGFAALEFLLEPQPSWVALRSLAFVKDAIEVEQVLSRLAESLNEASQPSKAYLESWNNRLSELIEESPDKEDVSVASIWRPTELDKLADAVTDAFKANQLHVVVEEISRNLNGLPDKGLVSQMEGEDEPASTLPFAGLKNRHADSFLLATMRSRNKLRITLAAAVDRGLLFDSSEIDALMQRGLEQYVQHYLETWSQRYDSYRLLPLAEYDLPLSWDEYRRWMSDQSTVLRKDYEDHLGAVVRNVVGLSRAVAGPNAELRSELRGFLPSVDWPRASRLERLVQACVAADTVPDLDSVLIDWRRFSRRAQDYRLGRLDDLAREPIEFVQLGRSASSGQPTNVLEDEWLTAQLQYIVDHGRWTLESSIYDKLVRDHFRPFASARPFIFSGGSFDDTDPLRLVALLDASAQVHEFLSTPGGPRERPVLASLAKWQEFLSRADYQIEVAYEPPAAKKEALSEFYGSLALRLPGLSVDGGAARPELKFDVAGQSDPGRYRWRPSKGRVEVTLGAMTSRASNLNAEMEPRVTQISAGKYGLIQFIREHGTPVDPLRNDWRIALSIDIAGIKGLTNEKVDEPVRAINFRIKFLDPATGLPAPVEWPDSRAMSGPPPKPPWALTDSGS